MDGKVRSITDLLQAPGNDKCADCRFEGVEYASLTLGTFLCESCVSVHRSLGMHISRPKSLKMDKWDQTDLQLMANALNSNASAKYEHSVPLAYRRPKPSDPLVIKEQWIRAKYEREEFVEGAKVSYLNGRREGPLMKRGKAKKGFQKRRFVLDATENTLKYYNREEAKDAKDSLRIDFINVTIVPEKVGNPNGMQISFERNDQIRSLYIYAETGQDLIEWYTAIRAAKLTRLAIAYPSAEMDDLCGMITRDFLREGWLHKTGPRASDVYRRRWFTLDNRRLMYFEDPLDPHPKGEIFIGSGQKSFRLGEGSSQTVKDPGFGFTLHTPERVFHFSAESEQERKEWMDVLQFVVSSPLSPQDSKILYRATSI